MTADDLATYFEKKIAKPVSHEVLIQSDHNRLERHFFVVEPVAVSNDSLHATVAFKHRMRADDVDEDDRRRRTGGFGRAEKQGVAHVCGEVEIPLRDGDTLQRVLDMAVADAAFPDGFVNEQSDGGRLVLAHQQVRARLSDVEQPSGPSGP